MNHLLEPYGPQRPLDELVEHVNDLYHTAEAGDYDERHTEIREQLPSLWREMIQVAQDRCEERDFRILDFGCGTGFAAEQLLQALPREDVSVLTCYDPCSAMLQRCQAKLTPRFPGAVFCDDLKSIPVGSGTYNLLATNSLLHHLPDPVGTMQNVLDSLAPRAVWIAGHEPSCRFYRRAECTEALASFQRQRKWMRFLQPENYLWRIKTRTGLRSNPAEAAARESVRRGYFTVQPTPQVIALLVDFHVAHSPEEMAAGRGLDHEVMQRSFEGTWKLAWLKTYSHMGPFYEGHLPKRWRGVCRELAQRFPNDGANFCSVWVRV